MVVVGAEARQGLAPITDILETHGLVLEPFDSPNGLEFALRAARAEAIVFAVDALDDGSLGGLRTRHPGRTWIAWTEGYSSRRTACLFESGADEVVNGTMAADELVARLIRAVRRDRHDDAETVAAGALAVNARTGEAVWNDQDIELTKREREVLAVLVRSAGRTVPREMLYRQVWGFAMARGDRTVDVNVKRIRDKLAAAGAAVEIKTRAGVGYRLELLPVETEAIVTEL